MIYSSLFLIGAISLPAYASGTELIETENPVDGNFIVTTAPGVIPGDNEIGALSAEDSIRQIIAGPNGDEIGAQSHGEVEQVYKSVLEGFAATLDEVGLHNVLNSPYVASVEQDGYVQREQVTWGLDRIDDENLPLDNSYNPTFGNDGEGVTAYIIDTGILATHDEFENRATQGFNSAADGKDYDCHGHGTHVAGTIGSKNYGVANKVKLVGVKVLGCTGSGTWSGVIAGIDWVKTNAKKPATANLSLGGGKNDAINTAIKNLHDSGVTTVVAAGNSNANACSYSPASEPTAITVGSTTKSDARSSFSNYGTCVDIFAPGSDIASTWIGSNTALKTISGTSMASPHVCGGAALYLGQYPNITPEEVLEKMMEDSIADTITNVGTGSPNQFLYVGSDQAPTTPTTSSPTGSPSVTPTTPNSSFGPTPQYYGSGEPTVGGGSTKAPTKPTKSPTKSPSASPSTTPTESKNICEDQGKSACKKMKESCVFGKSKIFGACAPKKSKYKHDCSQHTDETSCSVDENHGLCKFDDGVCVHICDDLSKKPCKKMKNASDNKKTCKPPKIKNPCKGCMPKTTCA